MALGAIILAMLRGCHVLALASLFGGLVSLVLVAPAGLAEAGPAGKRARQSLVAVARWSNGLALLTGIGWLASEAATMAGTSSVWTTLPAMATVLRGTQFGHLLLLRLALLLGVIPLLHCRGWRLAVAVGLAGVALAMQGGMGHAGAVGGGLGDSLLLFEALHLLAAGAWLGGLLPLFLLIRSLPAQAASASCRSFSPIGLSAVLLIAGTALVQSLQWIGGLGGLFGTRYGQIALLKLGLFCGLLALAGINRFALTDRLGGDPAIRRWLLRSIAAEAVAGVLVILVAGFLASGVPATHETPIWPFSWRPTLDVLAYPDGRWLVFSIVLTSALAGALLTVGLLWLPLFWRLLAACTAAVVLAGTKLAPLLTIDAYPTTFARSPTEFADSSIVRGAKLFAANCVVCHGTEARGDGPAAKSLPIPPADLTAAHFWMHTEGDLFWYISSGINAPSGAPAMPAFGDRLSSDDRWALIDYLKANNAGASVRSTGRWATPVPLPQFDALCPDGRTIELDDLRGRVLHFVAVQHPSEGPPAVDDPGVATIILSPTRTVKPAAGGCVTIEPVTWRAFAILLGVTPDQMAGTQALADQNGWLRARWRPGDSSDWNDPRVLAAVVRDITAHPLAVATGGHAHH